MVRRGHAAEIPTVPAANVNAQDLDGIAVCWLAQARVAEASLRTALSATAPLLCLASVRWRPGLHKTHIDGIVPRIVDVPQGCKRDAIIGQLAARESEYWSVRFWYKVNLEATAHSTAHRFG